MLPLKKDITKLKIMKSNKKHMHFKFNTIAIIYLALVTFIFLSLFFSSCSDDSDPLPEEEPTMAEALQNSLDEGLEKYNGIGISVAVFLPDGEKWAGASGISHGTVPITTSMPFGAGSTTKNFTAATIIRLAEEGKLNLDDSLHSWLPSYPNVDSTITIRQLLNHTSGLNDIADNVDFWEGIFWEPSKSWNPEDIIIAFNKEPVFPIGSDWNYSSTGYIMLRMIIEDITGSDICSVYKDLFFVPYGLTNTYASKGELQPGTAPGHRQRTNYIKATRPDVNVFLLIKADPKFVVQPYTPSHSAAGNILPGLRILCGSKTCLIRRITARLAGSSSMST